MQYRNATTSAEIRMARCAKFSLLVVLSFSMIASSSSAQQSDANQADSTTEQPDRKAEPTFALGRPVFRRVMWPLVIIRSEMRETTVSDPEQPDKIKRVGYLVMIPGTLATSKLNLTGCDWRDVLKLASARKELGLSQTQAKAITQITEAGDTVWKELRREEDSERPLKQLGELAEQLTQLLDSDQLVRLKQLMFRYQIDRKGFRVGGIPISNKVSDWMELKSKSFAEHVFERNHGEKFDWYKRLLAPLSDDQKDRLVQILGAEYIKAYRANWLLPAVQLMHSPLSQNEGSEPTDGFGYEGLLTVDAMHEAGVGHYEMRYYNDGNGSHDLGEAAFRSLVSMLNDAEIRSKLKLSAMQIESVDALIQVSRRDNGIYSAKGDYQLLSPEQLSMERPKAVRELSRKVEREIETFLTREQTAELKKQCAIKGARNRGIAASLIDGYLNHELEVTDDQREAIEAAARNLRRELREYDVQIRETFYDAMIECLDYRQQKQIREMMGEPLPGGWMHLKSDPT